MNQQLEEEMTDEQLEEATRPPQSLPYSPIPGHMTADGVAPGEVKTPVANPFDSIPAPKSVVKLSLKQYAVENVTEATPFAVAKLPPQARLIYLVAVKMKEAGKLTFSSKELTDESVKAGLQTRQLPERIINYYLPRLRADKLFI